MEKSYKYFPRFKNVSVNHVSRDFYLNECTLKMTYTPQNCVKPDNPCLIKSLNVSCQHLFQWKR